MIEARLFATKYTNFDDGKPSPQIEDGQGETRQLGLLLPNTYPAEMPRLTALPGFRTWSRQEIEEAIKTKPAKSRVFFEPKDWIEDQKQRGSCCPTATTAARRKAARYAGVNAVPRLAAEFLYSCVNRGKDQGALLDETMRAGQEVGWIERNDAKHPFNRDILKSDYTPEEFRDAAKWRSGACYQIDTEMDLATVILSRAGAAVVAVDVDDSFMKLNRDEICGGGRGPGNHAVHADDVEIINGELAFDMPNSWGLSFGNEGRAYLTWSRHLSTTHRYHRFFVIVGDNSQSASDEGPKVKA